MPTKSIYNVFDTLELADEKKTTLYSGLLNKTYISELQSLWPLIDELAINAHHF